MKFCDDVESIFTFKELEKAPLQEVVQFKPPEEWELNKLEPEAESMFSMCMDRISEKVRRLIILQQKSSLFLLIMDLLNF